MVSAEAPALFSKACELFILELTLRAWMQTEECNRRILQRCDIGRAIRQTDLFDFLPEEEADVDAGKNVEGTTELEAAAGVMMVMNYENELDGAGNQLDQVSQSYMINQEVAQPCMIQTPFLPFAQNQYNIYPK
ncbi:Nuclear transcription factor Y subunit C [Quillaja saponaria]|uniref:Nuclear transcription factor Y subunit C n=1 Tax=Quillaja saponaria TaxID=32244 RepID=A0AAD7Q6J6_QUISA|nr:Nuclear transcription factor Y subunit C [Quillaja saponaria]